MFFLINNSYEAWVIYNFLALCFAYGGGPGEIVRQAQEKDIVIRSKVWMCTCCLPSMSVTGGFLRRVKQGTLQFVFIKPVLAIITLVLNYAFKAPKYPGGLYHEGDYNPKYGYVCININIIIIIVNIIITIFFIVFLENLLNFFKTIIINNIIS